MNELQRPNAAAPDLQISPILQPLRWSQVADTLPIGIYICDRNGGLVQFNRKCAAIWGKAPEGAQQFCASHQMLDLTGRLLNASETPIAEALRTGKPAEPRDLIVEQPDGSGMVVEASAEPIFAPDGQLVGSAGCLVEKSKAPKREDKALQAIIETTPDCIKIVARDGTLLQINPAGLRMLEAEYPGVVEGISVFDFIAPEFRDFWKANHERVCNGEKLTWEYDIVSPSGVRRHMEAHAAPVDLADGTCGQLAITRDITERKEHDRRTREKDYRYRQVLQALPTAIYTTDADGNVTFFNQAAVEFAGRTPELGTDKWCVTWRLFEADGTPLPHDKCPMAVALKEQRRVEAPETIAERPDGSRVWFMPFPTPIFDRGGNLVGAVNMLIDVTERHEAELQSAMLANIVASSDDAIVSKTLDGFVTSWNDGAARIFGYSAKEMVGQHITKIIPPERHSEEDDILARLRRGEHIDHFETVRAGKDGRHIDVSVTISPMRSKSGELIGASKIARDITERKQAEKLQHLLVGELNHRVKNTLATVQSIANQTVYSAGSPEEFASSFGGRISALAQVHGLLTESTWQGAELSALVRDQLAIEGEDERVSHSGPSLTLNPQAALHLSLVLHELATNARKYGALASPRGRVSINWTVRTNGERQLLLQWQERGGSLVTVPQRRGFGTNLIEQSLQAHGGSASIHYESEGLTCNITLNLPPAEQSSAGSYRKLELTAAAEPKRPRLVQKPSISGKRILVVDDEPLIAMDIVAILEEEGCEVVGPASTLEKALNLVENTAADVAFVDANLAGEPVDALAAALTRRHVPFAFVSGYGREELPEAFQHAMLIKKPFQRQQLVEAVQRMAQEAETAMQIKRGA